MRTRGCAGSPLHSRHHRQFIQVQQNSTSAVRNMNTNTELKRQ